MEPLKFAPSGDPEEKVTDILNSLHTGCTGYGASLSFWPVLRLGCDFFDQFLHGVMTFLDWFTMVYVFFWFPENEPT